MARAFGLVLAALLFAQPARDDSRSQIESNTAVGVIRGRVRAATTHDPVRNARVTAFGEHESAPVLTDAEGRFAIAGLAPGEFHVAASKPGYAQAAAGARTPGAAERRIVVAAGEVVDNVIIELRRGAAISGVVVDDAGEPIVGASVMVERVGASERPPAPARVGITDDHGEYRVGGLSEGRVLVSVFSAPRDVVMLPNGAGVMMNAPGGIGGRIYYLAAAKASQAEPIALEPGDEKRGIDFTVAAKRVVGPRVTPVRDRTVISGRVVADDGRAIVGAQVALAPMVTTTLTARFAITDAEGAYQFALTPDVGGTFRVSAQRNGYLPAAFGQRSPSDRGDDVVVAPGEVKSNLDLVLRRPGAIAGTLFDENGDPVEGAVIRAFTVETAAGQRRLAAARTALRATDDLGRYRVAGLPPGEYRLAAFVGQIISTEVSIGLPGYATTFFPGTAAGGEARDVAVAAGQEALDIDFSLVRVRTARVSGQAFDAAGDPITGGIALMPSRRSGAILPATFGARIERDGRFEFTNVAPGEYVLQVSRHRQGAWNEGDSATVFVSVGETDVTNLELRASAGSTISGHIVVDGVSVKTGAIELSAIPVDSDLSPTFAGPPARASIDRDLRFELAGLRGPRRLHVLRMPAGLTMEAIRAGGVDITDTVVPLGRPDQSLDDVEVVLTNRITEIAGAVSDAHGHAIDGAAVVIFSVDSSRRYAQSRFVGTSLADPQGRYRFDGMPPDDYYVAAVDRRTVTVDRAIEDPDFLESLVPGASRVTVGDGAHVVVAIRVDR